MELIISGAWQGKTDYAKTRFGLEEGDCCCCTAEEKPDFGKKCLCHMERFALYCLRQGLEPEQVLLEQDLRRDGVFLCDDISCGVVPVDEETRAWREACGRMITALAQRAEGVTRVFCGLPLRLK